MTTLTIRIDEKQQAGKMLLELIEFFNSKEKETVEVMEEKSPYNPDFVKKIKRAQARGNYRTVNPDNIWESIS